MQARILIFLLFALTACRTVSPISQIRPSSAPDISRITLKTGQMVLFNEDFGWYDKRAHLVEGTTKSGEHVQYNVSEIARIENVRAYSIFFAAGVATVLGGTAIYVLARLLALL